MVVTKTPCQRF